MARKQDAYYFDNFIACAEESCQAASLLRKVLGDFKPQELEKYLEEIHEIEHRQMGKSMKCWTGWQRNLFLLLSGRIL